MWVFFCYKFNSLDRETPQGLDQRALLTLTKEILTGFVNYIISSSSSECD